MHRLDARPFDDFFERLLASAGVPGAAIAVVTSERVVFAKSYGLRDIEANAPMSPDTIYPIASTTKAINAYLISQLVEAGQLAWDVPVVRYLPDFAFLDPEASELATLHDLVTLRTGLPRHDWVWVNTGFSRGELVHRLQHLQPNAGFRERFQYNNLTAIAAGHVAEIVTGDRWEDLVRTRVLGPLGMQRTGFSLPDDGDCTRSYYYNSKGRRFRTRRFTTDVAAPAGGAILSSVNDMARWVQHNLRPKPCGLAFSELHTGQLSASGEPSAPSAAAEYGFGWFVDAYCGAKRISHGGLLHDVNSSVMIFPDAGFGLVSFVNSASTRTASLINEQAFHLMTKTTPLTSINQHLETHRAIISQIASTSAGSPTISNPHRHVGVYDHPAYGRIGVESEGNGIFLRRGAFRAPLREADGIVSEIDVDDLLDARSGLRANAARPITFEHSLGKSEARAVEIALEPDTPPIRFERSAATADQRLLP